LHNSVINGHFEAVRYLVENGADIQASGVVRLFIVPPLNVSRTIMRPYLLIRMWKLRWFMLPAEDTLR
jgi:hypothetical protein